MRTFIATIFFLCWALSVSSNDPTGGTALDDAGIRNLFVIFPANSNVTFCDKNASITCDAGSSCQIDSSGSETCVVDRFPFPELLRGSVVIPCDNTSTLVCDNITSCQIDLGGNETCAPEPIFHVLLFARGGVSPLSVTSSITPCSNTTTLVCDIGSTCQVDEASGNETCVFHPIETFHAISLGTALSCANTTVCDSGSTCQVNETGVDVCVPNSQIISPPLAINDLPVPTLFAFNFSGAISSCSNSSTLVCDPGTVCQDDGSGNETCVSPIFFSILNQVTTTGFLSGGDPTTDCPNTTTLVCDAGTICKVNATGHEACVYPIVFDQASPLTDLTPTPVIAEPTSASTVDSATTIDVPSTVGTGGFVCNLFCIQGYKCAPDSTGRATCVPKGNSTVDSATTIDVPTTASSGGFVCNLLCIQGYVCVPDSTGKATCVPKGSSTVDSATTIDVVASSGGFFCNLFCIRGYKCAPDSFGKATCIPDNSAVPVDPEWWPRVMEHFQGTNLKRCYKRRDEAPPTSGQKCSNRKEKTCFFGTKQCPNGVGPSPVTRCVCKGTWLCTDAVCPLSATDGIE